MEKENVAKTKDPFETEIQKIAERLKEIRKLTHTSAENFSSDHKLNRVQYWRLENGINFTITSLLKVLMVHKMTLSEFFKDLDYPRF
jgi:transcriptional regulator with XRE-family HTH domain